MFTFRPFICIQIAVISLVLQVNCIRQRWLSKTGTNVEMFVCNWGGMLEMNRVCDGYMDCADGADEMKDLCNRIICPVSMFKCYYGACVPKDRKCNGIRDCADGSDEMQCGRKTNSCAHNEFRCNSGHCIHSTMLCDGSNDCLDNSDESQTLCKNQICPLNSFKCNFGGCVPRESQCNGFADCLDGSDESSVLCSALQCPGCKQNIYCPPVKSTRLDVVCEYNQREVPCDAPMEPDTVAIYSCREYFIPANEFHENNDKAICQKDGTWSRNILKCKPDCGLISSFVPLVVNGWHVTNPLPWHVSLYYGRNSSDFGFWCGATLLTEAIIVTAAHCLWKINIEDVRLTFGSTRSHLNETDDFVETFTVKRVITHPLYFDKYGNYGSDIALIEINGIVDFSDRILPVCVDWELDDITAHLSDQSLGMVMGMGVTENDQFSNELRMTTLPVVANKRCVQQQHPDFRKYVTFTTFCAGWGNGTGVCNGDSGGGLVFPMKNSDRWCLQGIVSLSPRRKSSNLCDPKQFTIFTKVGIYVKWIQNKIDEIHSAHKLTLNDQNQINIF